MRKKLVSRVCALVFALMLLFANCMSVMASDVTPDDGRWADIEGDGYSIWAATKTDAGWLACVNVDADKNTATLTSRANAALADSHVINHSGLTAYDTQGTTIQNAVLSQLKAKEMWFSTYCDWYNADGKWNPNYFYWKFGNVTNAADFNPAITPGATNAAASAKLAAGGVSCKTTMIKTSGTGSLPGDVEGFDFAVPVGSLSAEDVYMYYYNASKDVFELAGKIKYHSNTNIGGESTAEVYTRYGTTTNMSKCGTYVISDAELPAAITTGNVVKVPTAGVKTTEALTTAITNTISSANAGDVVDVVVPAGTKVAKSVWETAKAKGVALTLESEAGTYVSWAFGAINNIVDFDPTVNVGAKIEAVEKKMGTVTLPATTKVTEIAFAYDGDLPGQAEVTLDLSGCGFTEGQDVILYYFNPTKNIFEKIDGGKYTEGFATFTMTHCSDYVVSNEELPKELTTAAPKTGDSANIALYVTILALGAAAIAVVVYKKRKDA